MLTRHLARAILLVLQWPAGWRTASDSPWYHTECIAAQLQRYGVAVRVNFATRTMVLEECITLPLYPWRDLSSGTIVARHNSLPEDLATLLVCATDLAAIPYRYCFGDASVPHMLARRGPGAWLIPVASVWGIVHAWWRLLFLLTPTPAEMLRAFHDQWHPSPSLQACDCMPRTPSRRFSPLSRGAGSRPPNAAS